ncbi:proton-coupled amino acid transporter-like protein CG1139 [Diorhabda sublineata]|uniref:proton-coupled amino acid transporter-like protein CG1139 n=1 Tax=Diorhabda sublineata TaxID=1163346 RepID=UPI0024E151CC|nr:proton-coupled amino acid transporter-like protein CG1139 [Diorhabda sublineata]
MSFYQKNEFLGDGRTESYSSFAGAISSREQLTHKDKDNGINPVELKDFQKSIEAGEYDPYIYREVKHPTTNMETLFHLLKGSLGTGILAMPLAFYHSGYLLGIIATALIGLLCTHCIHILIKCEYELCKRKKVPVMTYPATAEAALQEGPEFFQKFSSIAPHMVNIFLLIYQLGTGTVYTVFIGENIKEVLLSHGVSIDSRWVMFAALMPLILLNYVRNLKYLAPLSTTANFVTIASFGIIGYYMFSREFSFEGKEAFGEMKNYPLYFGTVLFALEAIGVIMPLENEMKTPQYFGSTLGVLNIGMAVIVLLYTSMGFFGYIAYGDKVGGSISYTIGNELPAQICKIMLSFAIYITHGLQMYPAIDTVWNQYLKTWIGKSDLLLFWEYLTRTLMVLFCFGLAIAVPYIELFISLFGALTLSALGLAIPAILDLSTYWDDFQGIRGILIISKNCLIILIGVFGLIIGTTTSLGEIYKKFAPT